MAEEVAEGAEVVEGEQPPGEGGKEKKLEYCKELSEEQLTAFYEKAANNEEAVQYIAMEVLKLPDFMYKGNIALILDYFVGIFMVEPLSLLDVITDQRPFILWFAQEEHMTAPHTLLMYQLGIELMENIKSGRSMKWTEKKFKDLVFRWSVKVKNTNHVPLLTTIELQKIVPFFMDTVFQHFRLYSNCFNREALHWRYYEDLWIETPLPWEPLKNFDTMEEIDKDKETQAQYKKDLAEWEVERLATEAKAQWLLENPLFPPPKPREPPANLDEYIDFSVSDKVEEVMKLLEEQYLQRRTVLFDRVQIVNEMTPKRKLIVKEIKFKLPEILRGP